MPTSQLSVETTLAMTVANTGFMLDRLGQDCAPLQFLRELTKNSIEAVLATPEKTGDIVWDVDWESHTLTGVYKLSITDTGVGMTGAEMVEYINQLSSSVHLQSHEGNFGVGAKITAATKNHAGLIYLSWKDGTGSMIHLWRDPNTNTYGLKQLQTPDGRFCHSAEIDDTIKPELIGDHGTKVILLGNTKDDDTMHAPEGSRVQTKWIRRYLNTRFFRFPPGITVRVREGWESPRSDSDRNVLRQVTGQAAYLEQNCMAKGSVRLTSATAHWWILRDEDRINYNSGQIASAGHIAALYKDELYEMLEASRGGVQRLQQFGVIFGYRQVVIYVEPDTDGPDRVTSNTARTHLLINNESLPWVDWAMEFRDSMPEEIVALIESITSSSETTDHKDSIRDRLKKIRDLFKLSRYRPTPKGTEEIDDSSITPGGKPGEREEPVERESKRGGMGGRDGSIYSLFLKSGGPPGEDVGGDMTPRIHWVSVKDGTRGPGYLEDRAAGYLPDTNELFINADFRVFTDMVERHQKPFSDIPGVGNAVEDVVREWFEQTLIEAILGVLSLKGGQLWSLESLKNAWSEEALTTSVMPRYHIDMAIKRAVSGKFGSYRDRPSSTMASE